MNIKIGIVVILGASLWCSIATNKKYNNISNKLDVIISVSNKSKIDSLEYELMNVDGVRTIKELKIVQQIQGLNLYRYSIAQDGTIQDTGTVGYGYQYDFSHSWNDIGAGTVGSSPGIVLPPHPNNPAVFELKNPKQNIQGVVL